MSDSLDRLFSRLVTTLAGEAPERAAGPVTISEIYQRLVPYRAVRGELDFSELPQYEHALLRLLAGERGYASIDLGGVQEEFAQELRATNPILGVYRDYAAVEVRLHPTSHAAPASAGEAPPAGRPAVPEPTFEGFFDTGGAEATLESAPAAAPRPEPRDPPAPRRRPEAAPPVPADCRRCHSSLPTGRDVWFCPFCGATQRPMPCAACGAPLEPDWGFCVRCGSERRVGEAAEPE
jgi:hypothetical protein